MSEQNQAVPGVMLAGEDGTLYAIPAADLAAYALSEDAAVWLRQQADTGGFLGPEMAASPGILITGPITPVLLPLQALQYRGRGLVEATPIPIP